MTPTKRYADGAQHLQKGFGVVLETDRCVSDEFKTGDHADWSSREEAGAARFRSCTLSSRATKTVGQSDEDRFLPVIPEVADQAFQQPCPKRVQLFDARDVDDDAVGGSLGLRRRIDQPF